MLTYIFALTFINTLILLYLFFNQIMHFNNFDVVLQRTTSTQIQNIQTDMNFIRKQVNYMVDKKKNRKKPGPKPGTLRKSKLIEHQQDITNVPEIINNQPSN